MSGSTRVEAPVSPEVLRWARESIGYSRERAAKLLGMTEANLELVERGARPVSLARLKVMAQKYDRPLIALLLPEVPQEDDGLPDFRTSPEVSGKSWTPGLHKAYRRVVGQRTIMLDIAKRGDDPIPNVDVFLRSDADSEEAGHLMRDWLGAISDISEIGESNVLRYWSGLIEAKGVLVTQVSAVPVEEMRGFSIGERPFPAIALNGGDTLRGRVFTLMHELTHVLLHRSSLCDLEETDDRKSSSHEPIERFCNSVAASALMPRAVLLAEPVVRRASIQTIWSEEDLAYLSGKLGVSEEAILRRLVTLNKASWDFYMERQAYYLSLYRNRKRGRGGPSHYAMTLRNLGRRYVRTVWNAYERGDISDPEVSRYLQTSLEHVPTLIERSGSAQ